MTPRLRWGSQTGFLQAPAFQMLGRLLQFLDRGLGAACRGLALSPKAGDRPVDADPGSSDLSLEHLSPVEPGCRSAALAWGGLGLLYPLRHRLGESSGRGGAAHVMGSYIALGQHVFQGLKDP